MKTKIRNSNNAQIIILMIALGLPCFLKDLSLIKQGVDSLSFTLFWQSCIIVIIVALFMELFSIDLFSKINNEEKNEIEMKERNFYLYNRINLFKEGKEYNSYRLEDMDKNDVIAMSNNLEELAEAVISECDYLTIINIEFKPVHEFVYSGNMAGNEVPYRCLSLTEEEKEVFFKGIKNI